MSDDTNTWGVTDEVRRVLSTSDEPISTREIYHRAVGIADTTQISGAIHAMRKRGEVVTEKGDDGHNRHRLARKGEAVEPLTPRAAAPAPAPKAPAATDQPQEPPPSSWPSVVMSQKAPAATDQQPADKRPVSRRRTTAPRKPRQARAATPAVHPEDGKITARLALLQRAASDTRQVLEDYIEGLGDEVLVHLLRAAGEAASALDAARRAGL